MPPQCAAAIRLCWKRVSDMIDILTRLANALPDGADAALIESDVNRRYLTGMKSSAGTLLVTRESSYLVIDFRYFEKAKATAKGCEVILQDKLYQQIKELCQKQSSFCLLFDYLY